MCLHFVRKELEGTGLLLFWTLSLLNTGKMYRPENIGDDTVQMIELGV